MFGTNHASAKQGMKVPSPPLNIALLNLNEPAGGEGTFHREAISVPNNIGWKRTPPHRFFRVSFSNSKDREVTANLFLMRPLQNREIAEGDATCKSADCAAISGLKYRHQEQCL